MTSKSIVSKSLEKPTCQPGVLRNAYLEPDDNSLLARIHRAFGPLAGGMILDGADFLTFGPIGLVVGLFVGAAVGWWVSTLYKFSSYSRLTWAILAALYCAVPFTSIVPLATLISIVGRLRTVESSQTADHQAKVSANHHS